MIEILKDFGVLLSSVIAVCIFFGTQLLTSKRNKDDVLRQKFEEQCLLLTRYRSLTERLGRQLEQDEVYSNKINDLIHDVSDLMGRMNYIHRIYLRGISENKEFQLFDLEKEALTLEALSKIEMDESRSYYEKVFKNTTRLDYRHLKMTASAYLKEHCNSNYHRKAVYLEKCICKLPKW